MSNKNVFLLSDAHPPASFTTKIPNNGCRQWTFVESVETKDKLLDQLEVIKRKYHCIHLMLNVLRNKRFIRHATFHCTASGSSKCRFQLQAKKTDKEGRYHLYTSEKHTCLHRDKDPHPPVSFTTPNGREWKFRESLENKSTLLNQIDAIKRKYHCRNDSKSRNVYRTTFNCTAILSSKCRFQLLAQKMSREGCFHLYTSGIHTCLHKEENVLPPNELLSDAHPPAHLATYGGQQWTFLETTTTGKSLVNVLRTIRRKYSCYHANMKILIEKQRSAAECIRMQLYCTMRNTAEYCLFKLLAQRTDRGRYHLYGLGLHTCFHANSEKSAAVNPVPHKLPLSDKHPPAKIVTLNGRRWTFMKTAQVVEKSVSDQLEKWAGKFHCRDNNKPRRDAKQQHSSTSICRVTFNCTAAKSSGCRFAVLVQRTDRGRFHFYWSGKKHTCLHAGKGEGGSWQEEKEEEDDDEEGELECDEEGKNEEEDEEGLEYMGQKEEVDEEDNVDNANDNDLEIFPIANALRSRSSTLPHEINDVQFIDFVDHPKSEGVKMRRLEEPKKEPGTDVAMINMEEEESTNRWQKLKVHQGEKRPWEYSIQIKMPKRENIKEDAPAEEDQPGPSNRGQQPTMPPMAMVNRQNQKPIRERWWVNAINHGMTAPNKEKRLLRERKLHINYRE